MKKFKEFEVKNLEQVMGGIDISIVISGLFDHVKGNEDVRIEKATVVEELN